MGRKKPFIDKSKATTYHVMYKEHDDTEDPFEFVSAADIQQRAEEAAEANSARHPLAFLYEDEEDQVQTEEQRQEIIGMGLPDDGYNYLKHMRAPGARTQMMIVPTSVPGENSVDVNPEEQKGSASDEQVFVPPEEDVMFYDASSLPASSTDEQQDAADGRLVTVSAFSRPIHHTDRVSKVTAMMDALDEDDTQFLEAEGCAPGPILGDGDLLDDFVESALQVELVEDDRYGPDVLVAPGSIAWGYNDDADASEASGDGQEPPRRTPASIADSFWRKEREDRTDAQTVMDERLIARMDLEYGDDDIGSLEDDEEATRSHRAWDTEDIRLQKVLHAYGERGQDEQGRSLAESAQLRSGREPHRATSGGAAPLEDPEDEERIARAKALEAAERYYSHGNDAEAESKAQDALIAGMLAPRRVADDCESILSSCSNVYNHPGQISDEQRRHRRKPVSSADVRVSGAGMVQLSSRTGLPRGVGTGLPGVSEEGSESDAESEQSEVKVNLGKARGKGETADDKKARKAAVKEAKRVARQRKKESKQVFAEANTSMQHHVASNSCAQRTVVHIV